MEPTGDRDCTEHDWAWAQGTRFRTGLRSGRFAILAAAASCSRSMIEGLLKALLALISSR